MRKRVLPVALLWMALLRVAPLQGQEAKPQPALDDVLTRVAENFEAYLHSIPNLFVEEQMATDIHVNAVGPHSSLDPGSHFVATARGTAVDGIFYLRHGAQSGQLVESREVKSIDHRPVSEGAKLRTPVLEENIFSYAESFLSPALMQCYDYRLLTNQRLRKQTVLIVEYKQKRLALRTRCPVHEPHSGRAFVDPVTMQVLRMEQRRTEHPLGTLVHDSSLRDLVEDSDTGTWNWAIDYAPVELNGKTFWLPKTITATTITNHPPDVKWTFVANYRNYHLLHVQSTLLPGYIVPPEPQ